MFRGHLRPGQGFRAFTVYQRESGTTVKGRPTTHELKEVGEIIGIISQATQQEIEQSKQNGHPISHTIVQRGVTDRPRPTDVLKMKENPSRQFYVQTVHDPGELGHFTVYKVLEREDM